MAITEEMRRQMHANSVEGAARQRAKDEEELKKYNAEREKNMKKAMSAKERNSTVISLAQAGVPIDVIASDYDLTEDRVRQILSRSAGVVDASELSDKERAELTAQAETDAGIVSTSVPEQTEQAEQTDKLDVSGVYQAAINLMMDFRKKLNVPDGVNFRLTMTDGLTNLEVTDTENGDNTAMLTWR